MESINQGNLSRSATEAAEQISRQVDGSVSPWGHDYPMAAFIDTYACIGLGGFDSPLAVWKGL
jgi:hypothetical protein